MTRRQIGKRLLALLRPLAPLMGVSSTARVLNQGLGVAIPATAAAMVVGLGFESDVATMAWLLVAMALAKGAFRYVEQFTGHAVAFRLLAELRIDTFRTLIPLAPAGLEDDRSGDLVSRVIGDIDRVEPFYAHTIAPMSSAIVVPLLTTLGLAVWVDPLVAVAFAPFPVLILVTPWLRGRRVAELASQTRHQAGETAALFTDTVQGAREIAVFRSRDAIQAKVGELGEATGSLRGLLSRVAAGRALAADLLAGAAVVTVTAVAVARFEIGAIALGGLAASVVTSWVATTPARAVEGIVADLDQALASAGRIFELADRTPPVAESGSVVGLRRGSVAFRDVTVSYPRTGSAALVGIDLEIQEGTTVAVVGPSGSGKSTLVELLARFRDPDRGVVQVGGVDISTVDPGRLRDTVAFVPQRPEIFFGTLEDNLRLAKPHATSTEIENALDRAGLGDWLGTLERGLDSPTGEFGHLMSGGERQRLAIARAFLRNPRILVLDEATSELDAVTERRILEELEEIRESLTTVIVAHRIDSITNADDVVVLDRGRLVEQGRHDALVTQGGLYAGLWQRHLDVMAESV